MREQSGTLVNWKTKRYDWAIELRVNACVDIVSAWLLETDGSFNLDMSSITCDTVEIAGLCKYWLRRKCEGNNTLSSQ